MDGHINNSKKQTTNRAKMKMESNINGQNEYINIYFQGKKCTIIYFIFVLKNGASIIFLIEHTHIQQ